MSWHTIGISALYAYFFSSPEGLSQLEAEKRRFSNQSAGDEYKQLLLHTLLGLPLIYLIGIFLVAFGAFANGYMYAGGLGIAVGIIYTIVFLREARQRVNWTITLTNLNQEKVTVYRDGEPKMHMPGDLVLGDVVELKPNMILPVTVRLIEAEHLFIANDAHSKAIQKEAINHPKEKSVVTKILFPEKEWRETNPINMALAGSLIIKGAGKGIVVDIPADTNTWWLAEKFHMEPLFSWSSAQYYPLAFASMLVVILLILSSLALDDKSHGFFDIILGSISFALLVFPVTAILLNIHQANIQIQNLLRKHIAVRNTKVFTSLLDTSLVVADADYLLQEHIAVEEKNYLHNLSAQGLHFIMLTTKSKEWLVHKLKE